jgi:lipoate-protein ligase A
VADLAACRSLGLDVVRRITGGRAVLHDREVTYAVIAPRVDPLFSGGILDNYRLIAAVLQKTVASYGIPAELQSGRCSGAGRHSACFIAPSSWELVYRGRKMAGSAQKRNDRAFLQHGSIPVETDLRQLQAALGTVDTDGSGLRLLEEKVGWLNRWLETAVTVDDVEDRLIAHFAGTLGISFREETPTPGEWQRAKALQAEKYGNPLWNFQGLGG